VPICTEPVLKPSTVSTLYARARCKRDRRAAYLLCEVRPGRPGPTAVCWAVCPLPTPSGSGPNRNPCLPPASGWFVGRMRWPTRLRPTRDTLRSATSACAVHSAGAHKTKTTENTVSRARERENEKRNKNSTNFREKLRQRRWWCRHGDDDRSPPRRRISRFRGDEKNVYAAIVNTDRTAIVVPAERDVIKTDRRSGRRQSGSDGGKTDCSPVGK